MLRAPSVSGGLAALVVALLATLATVAPATAEPTPPSVDQRAPASVSRPTEETHRNHAHPEPAFAARLAGDVVHPRTAGIRPWPGRVIRYWAKLPRDYAWSLRAAVSAWNRTGLDMTFRPAPKSRAQLRITIDDTQGYDGLATVGYQRRNWVHLRRGLVDPAYDQSDAYARVVAAHIITHELGHNLGLEHSGGCDLMTPTLFLPDCTMMADQPGYYACRVVDRKALSRTVAIYGGSRSLAPRSCPVDALPSALDGVAFDGGLSFERPVSVAWERPRGAPPGATVLGLVAPGAQCRFPLVRDFWGEARYDEGKVDVVRLAPGAAGWVPRSYGVDTRCFGVQLVNRSGAGRAAVHEARQSWVSKPAAPTLGVVRRFREDWYGEPGHYLAQLSPATGTEVAVLAGPTGACPEAWPAGEQFQDHLLRVDDDGTAEVASDETEPCLAFFGVRDDLLRAGDPVTWQVGAEPAPEPPVVTAVDRDFDSYVLDAGWDQRVAGLAYLVAPTGECVTTWPEGEDPEQHLAWSWLDAAGTARPCFSFFTVDALGGLSEPAVTWQVPPAPAPPTPSVSGLLWQEYVVSGTTTLDTTDFGLVVVERPAGACVTSFPLGEDPRNYLAYLEGTGAFSVYVGSEHPCLTFFAVNDDGVVGPAVQRQL